MTNSRQWSPQQQDIFSWFAQSQGNLVVRARAGTGKTTTILAALDHSPRKKILLCAFNKRIATELETKLTQPNAVAKTLHSVGYSVVMRQWGKVAIDDRRGFKLAKKALAPDGSSFAPNDAVALVAHLAAKAKGMMPFATFEELTELAEDLDLTPDEGLEDEGFTTGRIVNATLRALEMAAKPNEGEPPSIDFDDMLFVPVANNWVKGVYDLVVVDEAQDMNYTQLLLAQRVCKAQGSIVVVGDDRQAIYGFRGADSGSIDRLKKELEAQELPLNTTYRCPQKVVALAKQLVPDYTAAPTAPEGVVRATLEAKLVPEVQPGDFVLSRKNAPLVGFCLATLRTGKRARIEGKDIGKGLLVLIRKMKARDLVSLTKKLCDWLDRETRKAIAAKDGDVDAAAPKIQQLQDTVATIEALGEGVATVGELEQRIETLFSETPTRRDPETGEEVPLNNSYVVFSSVHKAKGLETDRVFLLEESFKRKPRRGSDESDEDYAQQQPVFSEGLEEINIRYVAITRAKQELVWVKGGIQEVA